MPPSPSHARRPVGPARVPALALAGVFALGAVLRFGFLGRQGFWYDEAFSSYLVRLPTGQMLGLIRHTESTPPVYYLCARGWTRIFGAGETGLRSLSALAGTLTLPLAYAIGRRLASPRVGLVVAALAACSPLLVWYSQEARAYALAALLGAASVLLTLRALGDDRLGPLAAWALTAALAVATHYDTVLLVLPEAAWLLAAHRRRRAVLVALVPPASVGVALLPLAVTQKDTGQTGWIARIPLGLRLDQLPKNLLAGFGASPALLLLAAAGTAAGVALLVTRADPPERGRALRVAGLGLAALALALLLAAVGTDDLITRNVIVAWMPLAAALGVGLGARRGGALGVAACVAVCASGVGVWARVQTHAGLQRPDWRPVARALGPPAVPRLIAVEHVPTRLPLALYQRGTVSLLTVGSATVRELDVVSPETPHGRACWWGAGCNLPRGRPPRRPPAGFRLTRRLSVPDFVIVRLRARAPVGVTPARVRRELPHLGRGAMLVQAPGASRRIL